MADPFEDWAIVELMGHRRLAGYAADAEMFGTRMLRLDIYDATGCLPVLTQFYGGGAVYCLTPTTEDIARKIGGRSSPAPVSRFELEQRPADMGPAPGADDGPGEDMWDEDGNE